MKRIVAQSAIRILRWVFSVAVAIGMALAATGVSHAQSLVFTTEQSPGRITIHTVNAATGQLRFYGYAFVNASVPGDNISNVVATPSGEFVYAADTVTNEIYGFSVTASGQLQFISASFPQPVGAGAHLAMVTAASSGNTFLYAFEGGSMFVETISPSSGAFTNTSNPSGAAAPSGATQMVFDPSGKYAYFGTSSGVAAFTIDPGTGALTANGSITAAGETGSDNVIVRVAPTQPFLYAANPNDGHIYAFTITSTGTLQAVAGTAPATGNLPSDVAVDPQSKFVFVSNNTDATVSPYLINSDGSLTVEAVVSVGPSPQGLVVDPSDHFLYVQDQTGSASTYRGIQTFNIVAPGAGLTLANQIGEQATGPMAILGGSVTYAPQFAFTANEGFSNLSAYQVDPTTGNLTQVTNSPFASGGAQTIGIAVDPFGRYLFGANGSGNPNTVSALTIGETGNLASVTGSPFSSSGFSTRGVAEDGAGQFAYVLSAGNNEISEFTVNQSTGVLAPISGSPFTVPNGGNGSPSAIAVSPFGTTFFVANTNIDTVSALGISATGVLSNFTNSPINTGASGAQTPVAVAVDPTNRFVYVANSAGKTIAAYQFSDSNEFAPISGDQFTFATAPAGASPTSIAIEPTGHFLYLTTLLTPNTGAIAIYQINQTSGVLTLVGTPVSVSVPVTGGDIGGGTLQGLAIDPTGQFLYAVANNESSSPTNSLIFEFTIDPTTGALTAAANPTFPVAYGPTSMALTANVQVNLNSSPTTPFAQYSNAGPIEFGEVNVNATGTQTLTLTNTGNSAFTVSGITLQGSSSAFTITNAVCNNNSVALPFSASISLGPGGICTFTLQFLPTLNQNGQAELLVVATTATNSNAPAGPGGTGQAFLLAGDGVEPFATFSNSTSGTPTTVAFGSVPQNTLVTQTLTVSNTGTGPLIIQLALISSPGVGFDYTQVVCNSVVEPSPTPFPLTISPSGSCTFTVGFDPRTSGPLSTGLGFADNAGVGASNLTSTLVSGTTFQQTVSLTGSGAAGPAPTTTTITSTTAAFDGFALQSNVALVGSPVTVNFTVKPTSGGGNPTGTVTVSDTSGDSCSNTAQLVAGAGSCPLTIKTLGAGTASLTATYVPDSGSSTLFTGGTSVVFTENVVQIASCGMLPSSMTSTQGSTVTYTISVCLAGDVQALPSAIATNCPTNAMCSVAIVPVQGQAGAYTVTLTIVIGGSSGGIALRNPGPRGGPSLLSPAELAVLLMALLLFLLVRRRGFSQRRSRPRLAYGVVLILALALSAISGCNNASTTPPSTATPPGTFTINVTITAGGFSSTVPVSLTVTP